VAKTQAETKLKLAEAKKKEVETSGEALEVGAGVGRFPLVLKNSQEFKNIDITCLEINKELVQNLKSNRLNALEGSVLKMPFSDNHFLCQ